MAKVSLYILFLLCIHQACAQFTEDLNSAADETPERKRTLDPVSAFLSELGNLILDADGVFSRQTAPKVNLEDAVKEQLYGRNQAMRSSYFSRIRENYRNLQKRVGETLGMSENMSMLSHLVGVDVQDKGSKSFIDVALPFLPLKLSVSSTRQFKDNAEMGDSTKSVTNEPASETNVPKRLELPQVRGSLKVGEMEISVDSKPKSGALPDVSVGIKQDEPQQRSSRHTNLRIRDEVKDMPSEDSRSGIEGSVQGPMRRSSFDTSIEKLQKFYSRNEIETGEVDSPEADSKPSGRILGDILYSESTFDKIMKRVMKDTKWLIDTDLSPSKVLERLNPLPPKVPQQNEKPNTTEMPKQKGAPMEQEQSTFSTARRDQTQGSTKEQIKRQSLNSIYYGVEDTKSKRNGVKLDVISQSDPELKIQTEASKLFKSQQENIILLAFTPEGVPLKLKMPPKVENPLKFIHETLSSADVALNIPIESHDEMEPVGEEILQLGSGNGGMMTRALYIDLSDSHQLKSLLKTLKKFRSAQKKPV